jgi:hypothetical protein
MPHVYRKSRRRRGVAWKAVEGRGRFLDPPPTSENNTNNQKGVSSLPASSDTTEGSPSSSKSSSSTSFAIADEYDFDENEEEIPQIIQQIKRRKIGPQPTSSPPLTAQNKQRQSSSSPVKTKQKSQVPLPPSTPTLLATTKETHLLVTTATPPKSPSTMSTSHHPNPTATTTTRAEPDSWMTKITTLEAKVVQLEKVAATAAVPNNKITSSSVPKEEKDGPMRMQELVRELQTTQQERDNLQTQLEQTQRSLTTVQSTLQELQKQVQIQGDTLQEYVTTTTTTTNDEQQQQPEQRTMDITQLQQELRTLQDVVQAKDARIVALEEYMAERQSESDQLKGLLRELLRWSRQVGPSFYQKVTPQHSTKTGRSSSSGGTSSITVPMKMTTSSTSSSTHRPTTTTTTTTTLSKSSPPPRGGNNNKNHRGRCLADQHGVSAWLGRYQHRTSGTTTPLSQSWPSKKKKKNKNNDSYY